MSIELIVWLSWMMLFMGHTQASTSGTAANANPLMKYVKASPPAIAIRCLDGILCVAVHIPDGPLDSNIGTRRIEQIDRGTLLLTSGWRTDGIHLVDKAREFILNDVATFGSISTSSNIEKRNMDYGKRLANILVGYMVDCHVNEGVRSLATVGILATLASAKSRIIDDKEDTNVRGILHFVDVTGIYPCRALAIGMHSDEINQLLAKEDVDSWSVDQARQKILHLLRCRDKSVSEDENSGYRSYNMKNDSGNWKIPKNAVIEIVIMRAIDGSIQRTREPYASNSTDDSKKI